MTDSPSEGAASRNDHDAESPKAQSSPDNASKQQAADVLSTKIEYVEAALMVSGVIMIATVVQSCVSYSQLRVMNTNARQTQQALDLTWMQIRPSLYVIAPTIEHPLPVGRKYKCVLPVHNSGLSNATVAEHSVVAIRLPPPLDLNLVIDTFKELPFRLRSSVAIPPQKQVDIEATIDNPLTDADIEDIKVGKIVLYLLSKFRYTYARGGDDIVYAFHRYEPTTGRLLIVGVTAEEPEGMEGQ